MASVASYKTRLSWSSVRINSPFISRKYDNSHRPRAAVQGSSPENNTPPNKADKSCAYLPRDKASNPPSSNVKPVEKMKSDSTAPRMKITLVLVFLVLISSGAAVGYFTSPRALLAKFGLISTLEKMGTLADPQLKAKIVDLSKQIEDLQRMVTMLIPQQQQRIEEIEQIQQEQQQKQIEQERRDEELREEERKRAEEEERRKKEEEMKIAEEIKRQEKMRLQEEKEKAEEMEKIRELEEQKARLQLELIKHEEVLQRKMQEEKLRLEKAEEEDGTCSSEGSCEDRESLVGETLEESLAEEPIAEDDGTENKEKYEAMLASLTSEKNRLKEEMADWEKFKSKAVRSSQRRNKEASRLLSEVKEKEKQHVDEIQSDVASELHSKLEAMSRENVALRELLEQLDMKLSNQLQDLHLQLEDFKDRLAAEEQKEESGIVGSIDTEKIQSQIDKSLALFAADRVAMPDYALESSGAVVFTIGDTEPYTRDTPWMGLFGISIWRSCKTPRLAIQEDNSPGNCWSFTGSKGALTIQLSAQVFPEFFTIDHIPRELAPNRNASSAPYHFRVLGLDYGNAPKGHVLGNYEFNTLPIQTFPVQQNPYEKYFRFIKVEILSNHGNREYTCLYRFRVHGRPHDTESYNG